jgi:tripartite-type tricarboxylate transporter receptor subunit TctC
MKLASGLFAVVLTLAASAASAQTWPTKPVKVLVPFGAGGIADSVSRAISDELTKRLGQPFVVENRTGAGGMVAAQALKQSAPDGYTTLVASLAVLTPVFVKDNPMDASKELLPVSLIAFGDWYMYVRPELGVASLKDLAAKGKAGKLRFGSPSNGNHALTALVAKRMGFEFENIPYKTTDQVLTALFSGDIDFTLNSLGGHTGHLQAGKLRAIATLAPSRSPLTPDVLPAKEQGVEVENRFNQGLWVPLGTPRDVVSRFTATTAEAVKSPDYIKKLQAFSLIAVASSPEEQLRAFHNDVRIYQEATKLIGLQPQ